MSNLIAIAFKDEQSAGKFMTEVGRLRSEGLIELEDAATLVRDEKGKAKIKQARSLVGEGALGGAFWGMLIGLLFFLPFVGLAVGAAMGAFAGKASDYGIDDDFIKEAGEKIKPGSSAIFLLVSNAQPDKVIEDLKQFHGEIIHTSLSKEQELQLKEAFSAA
jgi:uncharacterized membrane protein